MFWDAKKTQKLNDLFQGKLEFLQNNFYSYQDYALVGTKGYCYEGKDSIEHFLKLRTREIDRLRVSFETDRTAGYDKFIMFLPVYYHDNDSWPAHAPVCMWFDYGVLNDFLKEWVVRMDELKSGVITRDEYFEWKINWPQTCDGCGKYEPKKKMANIANTMLPKTGKYSNNGELLFFF